MNRDAVNAAGLALQAIRQDSEDLIVSFGAHAPSSDCRNGHVSVVIRSGADEGIGEAVSLIDAILLARGQIKAAAQVREKKAAEAKASLEVRP